MKKVILIVLFLFVSSVGFADDDKNFIDPVKRLRVEGNIFVGSGSEDTDMGTTTSGKAIMLSAGGGTGGGITLGYTLTPKWDLDVTVGMQKSDLSVELSNGDGSFERNFFLTTLKYKIPVSANTQAKIGAGLGCYISGEADIDFSQVVGGSHDIIGYDTAVGFHITGEYELFFSNAWSASIGAKYYNVSYEADSYTNDGFTVDPAYLLDQYREPDGSGFDLIIALSKYF